MARGLLDSGLTAHSSLHSSPQLGLVQSTPVSVLCLHTDSSTASIHTQAAPPPPRLRRLNLIPLPPSSTPPLNQIWCSQLAPFFNFFLPFQTSSLHACVSFHSFIRLRHHRGTSTPPSLPAVACHHHRLQPVRRRFTISGSPPRPLCIVPPLTTTSGAIHPPASAHQSPPPLALYSFRQLTTTAARRFGALPASAHYHRLPISSTSHHFCLPVSHSHC